MKRLFLLLWLIVFAWIGAVRAHSEEDTVVLRHKDPDPQRKTYLWNPFPGFCGPNATAIKCGGVCPETCRYKSLKCPAHCGVPCKCKQGYVFEEIKKRCVLLKDCPKDKPQQTVITHRVFQ